MPVRFRLMLTLLSFCIISPLSLEAASKQGLKDPFQTAQQVDRLIEESLAEKGMNPSGLINDEDFLRRATIDLTGRIPSPAEMTYFGLDADPIKRAQKVRDLLDTEEYAQNWAAYWRDVVYMRATEHRAQFLQGTFQQWMQDQLQQNVRWDEIATQMLTAVGDVRENGATALFLAHSGEPAELASETSRIFLGIQMQCANCHDHPTDTWTRKQFHELAAYFPRVRVRPRLQETPRSVEGVSFDRATPGRQMFLNNPERLFAFLDQNGDGKLVKTETERADRLNRIFDRLLTYADIDKDEALSLTEIKNAPTPPQARNNNTEYFMPDLTDPAAEGTRVEPVFFLDASSTGRGLKDQDRRLALANAITNPENEWFAKAFVNRIWNELIGSGFYMPIDDIGPLRAARHEAALETLSQGFTETGYDIQWLFETIMLTRTYQRSLVSGESVSDEVVEFACAAPTRLRSEQILAALLALSGQDDTSYQVRNGRQMYMGRNSPRNKVVELFQFDPSTARADVGGDIPQSLFMMNSTLINQLVSTRGNGPLANLVRRYESDEDALRELYVLVFSREPTRNELTICKDYLYEVSQRNEAFEDIMWSLVNSSEFITKR